MMRVPLGDIRTPLSDAEDVRELLLPQYLEHGMFWMHTFYSAWVLENANPTHYDLDFIGTKQDTLEGVYRVIAHLDEHDSTLFKITFPQ